ncbi:LOW QUALITY PROTEIN: putative disease resistance RPP13-like protein 3 [Oryza brachyantha]|uniref:LOW QUALITY PROTEIN: putative disease resistance RPP13-like protein 3 n=1 Tax=Oryza brachyantha TaxID=4533 RepID=UPI001AD9762A|nr:LOW QUALITY PROTEIN: putative disease resistance RPP13-like protein 3 [Oryza brachyantha]
MAEAAVIGMARSLLGSAIRAAASAAGQEITNLFGVQKDIRFIEEELTTMQAFLRAIEVTKDKYELEKVWADKVRDLAYDIEDCLEDFAMVVKHQSLSQKLMKLRHRHRIAVKIRSLKLRVEELSSRKMRYDVPSSSGTDDFSSSMDICRHQGAHYVDEADLVGFAGPKNKILEMISSSENAEFETIWIVGTGGLGKTTLAKKVYESSNITSVFHRAWVTVSQSFDVMDLLKGMIKQLLGKASLDGLLEEFKEVKVKENNLMDHLKEGLRNKRYFLVLDDLWSIEAWACIKPTLWGNNGEASRVVVTTRNKDLAKGSSSPLVYHLQALRREDATKLLLAKTNKSMSDIKKDGMNETFEKILKKCGGLPLAIVTIGGLLAASDVKEWEELYAQLPSELENNPTLDAMRKVLALSFKYLPFHLKPCFLYLSIFPEDFEIQKKRLVYRWIAEGFAPRDGVSIVDVAIKYFNELINRSLIEPSRLKIDGTIKSCRVHDIMVSISRDEKFVYWIGDKSQSPAGGNIRHVAYYNSNSSEVAMEWNRVRPLTVFGKRPKDLAPLLCSSQLRMLRVMDVQGVRFGMTQKEMDHIGSAVHLKYMNIQCERDDINVPHFDGYSIIYRIPRSIGKLQGLRVLDISNTYIASLPTMICELQSLCVLRCTRKGYYDFLDPFKPRKLWCIHVMKSLANSHKLFQPSPE